MHRIMIGSTSTADRSQRAFKARRIARNSGTGSKPAEQEQTGTLVSAQSLCTLRQERMLMEQRLSSPLRKLYKELTNQRLHASWILEAPKSPVGNIPILCPTAQARLRHHGALSVRCRACQRRGWSVVTTHGKLSRRFAGNCGSLNFCVQVSAASGAGLILMIQRKQPPRGDVAQFARAVALLRLIAHDLASSWEESSLREQTRRLSSLLQQVSTEERRLHRELHRRFPELPARNPDLAECSRSEQIVGAMQDYVLAHYHVPLQLGDVATVLGRNATYLSTLFSRTTGVTFHHYLEEVRLARAKELLSDPANRVCEVACAVGYGSASHFRHVFRGRTGVAPHLWHSAR